GDPSIYYYRKNSAAANIDADLIKKVNLDTHRHIHITGISPALSQNMRDSILYLVKEGKKKGLSISFDPNIRVQLWESRDNMIDTMNYIASYADYIIPNLSEGKILTGKTSEVEIAEFFLQKGVKNVIVKLGNKGCFVKNS